MATSTCIASFKAGIVVSKSGGLALIDSADAALGLDRRIVAAGVGLFHGEHPPRARMVAVQAVGRERMTSSSSRASGARSRRRTA